MSQFTIGESGVRDLLNTKETIGAHAMYIKDAYIPFSGLTEKQYVDVNVNSCLKDEGEATLTNIEVRGEILKNSGRDIGIAGAQEKEYEIIYNDSYSTHGDRDKARQEIGDVFADKERSSTDSGKTCREYYSKTFEDHFDECHEGD